MNARRAVVAAVAAWLVVVVVGSVLAWAVISRAGEEVSGDAGEVPSTTDGPTTGSTPTLTGRPGGSASPSGSPSSSGSPSDSESGPPASPVSVERTWQGLGGFVVVECEGPAARLVAAQADSGFVIEVKKRGPDRVEVEFEGQGDRDDQGSKVRASCSDGVPSFDVDIDAD